MFRVYTLRKGDASLRHTTKIECARNPRQTAQVVQMEQLEL